MIRKYNVNDDFFKQWSHEMAYLLGFIAADGCVNRNYKLLTICLCIKDIKHLYKIKEILSSESIVSEYHCGKNNSARINISSKTLCEDLKQLNITERKSLTLIYPNIPDEFESDFARGYFDGDGCIHIEKSYNEFSNIKVSIVGTSDILQGIMAAYAKSSGAVTGMITVNNKNHNYYMLHGTKSPIDFCNWMYEYSTDLTRLNRKYDIYIKYLETHGENIKGRGHIGQLHHNSVLSKIQVDEIREKWSTGISQVDLVLQYGVSSAQICGILHNKYWIDPNYQPFNPKVISGNKINFEIAQEIREKYNCGQNQTQLKLEYNLSLTTISNIVTNKSWKQKYPMQQVESTMR